MADLSIEERLKLVMEVGEEVVTVDELRKLLESNENLIAYDGFEPSGQMHIAQGILRAINVNKMTKAGFTFKMWVADWFAYLNNKMGGDMEKIHKTGEYFVEVWKAAGMDLDNVLFEWTSEYVKKPEYWELVLKIGKANSLKRVLKTTQIMGRSETDDLTAAQIIYPLMQATDIFMLGARVAQLGMDQRKVNMLAREVGPQLGYWAPISVSHHMLQGLGKPASTFTRNEQSVQLDFSHENPLKVETLQVGGFNFELILSKALLTINIRSEGKLESLNVEMKDGYTLPVSLEKKLGVYVWLKELDINDESINALVEYKIPTSTSNDRAIDIKMSKSIPDTAIFMTDSSEDIQRKINNAYCNEGEVTENPILDYCKHILFNAKYLKGREDFLADGFVVKRPEKFGGDVTYATYADLETAFANKELFPLDLKNAVVEYIDQLLEPVRKHFAENEFARELLKEVQSFQITR